jgi:uncharacterized protein YkwD
MSTALPTLPIRVSMRAALKTLVVSMLVACFVAPAPASAGVRLLAADSLERAVVARMNAVRKSHGLRALTIKTPLRRAAHAHAGNMARHGYFAHSWSNGAPFGRWIRRYWPGGDYRSWSAGENLYWRSPGPTAVMVVRAWMNSAPHRRNLLNRSWRAVGVGAVLTLDPFGAYAGVPSATIIAAEYGRRS